MICPKCHHVWKLPAQQKGGSTSRRTLSPDQAKAMAQARQAKRTTSSPSTNTT